MTENPPSQVVVIPEPLSSDYEAVPYPDFIHRRTNPDQIAAIGRLYGVDTARPDQCQVLELGCGQGGNLIAMAVRYPESKFVGLDLSVGHIQQARENAKACRVSNVSFRAMDLREYSHHSELRFDYIIAHGVYSWVPTSIAEQVLRIIHESLSPQGIAFVSYNTFPGWHAKLMIREMVRFHCGDIDCPIERIQQAKQFLEDLSISIPESTAYGATLREEVAAIAGSDEAYLFHELFEAINRPLHFHEFVNEISAASLHYIGEANLTFLPTMRMPDQVRTSISKMPRLEREQHTDFFGKRSFRQSLISAQPSHPELNPNALKNLWLSTRSKCSHPINLDEVQLVGPGNVSATVKNQATRIVIERLASLRGSAIAFPSLWDEVTTRTMDQVLPVDANANLCIELLQLAQAGLIEIHTEAGCYVSTVSEKPKACGWARYQAGRADGSHQSLASRRHEAVRIDEATRHLLIQCDGEKDLDAITVAMQEFVLRDGVTMQSEGKIVSEESEIRQLMGRQVRPSLERLAELAFLIE